VFDLRSRIFEVVDEFQPNVVALEIDPLRFEALRNPQLQGRAPLTFRLLRYLQKKIATAYHTTPGKEMLDAFDAARGARADVAMVDMDARQMLVKLQKAMPRRRRIKLFFVALVGIIGIGGKRSVEEELDEFDRDPEKFFDMMEEEYPELKRVLVDERNELMALRIRHLCGKYPRVMSITGDAHVPGMARLLDDLEPRTMRLRELRRRRPRKDGGGKVVEPANEVTVSFDIGDNGSREA
jgi:pheromone shutdown protein TraB